MSNCDLYSFTYPENNNYKYEITHQGKYLKVYIYVPNTNFSWTFEVPRKDFQTLINLLTKEVHLDKKKELTKKLEELDKQRQELVEELRSVS